MPDPDIYPTPAPRLPHVSTGTVSQDAAGAIIWTPDPRETYVAGSKANENGVERLMTQAEVDALPPPPAPDKRLRKSTVYDRVKGMGKVPALLQAFTQNQQASYEWNMPGWPNIFSDDPTLLAVLNGIGCTPAEVAAITAPDPLGPFPGS